MIHYFINREIRASLRKSTSKQHHSLPFDRVKTILVIYEAKDEAEIKPILSRLKKEKKTIKTCVYVNKEPIEDPEKIDVLIRKKEDVSFWGIPSREKCQQLNALQANLLINLAGEENDILRYLSLNHPCTFKAGINYDDRNDFDLALSAAGDKDLAFLFDQILFYLRAIRMR